MFYRKNMRTSEQVIRLVAGCAIAAAGWVAFRGGVAGWIAIAAGTMTLMTGLAGFCPACALVGRRSLTERKSG
jgi:hypothetical protein